MTSHNGFMGRTSSWSPLSRLMARRPVVGASVTGVWTAVVVFAVVEGIGPRGKYLGTLLSAVGIGVVWGLFVYWWEHRRQKSESPE